MVIRTSFTPILGMVLSGLCRTARGKVLQEFRNKAKVYSWPLDIYMDV